jgi:integrase
MIGEEGITAPPWLTKNGRAHSFPIANFTSCVLSKLNTVSSRLIFPARSFKSSFCGWGKRKAALDKRSGATNWTLHDLRRTFASGLQRLGVRLAVTEAPLDHVSGSRVGIVGVTSAMTSPRKCAKL